MNARIKQWWIDELRSGKFKQGRLALRSQNNEYCCLGVLCELYRQEHHGEGIVWELPRSYDNIDGLHLNIDEDAGETLPVQVMYWANLAERDPKLNGIEVSRYNDGFDGNEIVTPHTFEQIADLIEKHL